MDDAAYGARDRRGDWKPFRHVEYPAVFVWPAQPLAVLRWLFGYPGYILPWNLLYAAIAVAVWLYLTPPVQAMQTFAPGWIALVLARNLAMTRSSRAALPSTSQASSAWIAITSTMWRRRIARCLSSIAAPSIGLSRPVSGVPKAGEDCIRRYARRTCKRSIGCASLG